ncbi:hypothetical protein HU200_042735 [Digitaria exilis]|uniref:MORF/ORRM1/DAG-like MORF domain-containing protein n=1 Tax=Digitaria exilis TaxID=1010633 RepID=A0A835BD25_9POAL|nr:hypothetical protein HU200_042735 [Digitaria exilis]
MAAAAAARRLLSRRATSSSTASLSSLLRREAAGRSAVVAAASRLGFPRGMARRPGGDGYSPMRSGGGGGGGDRAPTEMAPLFPGCDYEHWLIVMDKPGGEGATKQQMIDCYIQTLSKVLGSEEEAKKKIYNVSCERYFGFGCEIDEETSNKLEGLPGVLFVLPDSYVDPEYKDYGGSFLLLHCQYGFWLGFTVCLFISDITLVSVVDSLWYSIFGLAFEASTCFCFLSSTGC